MPEIDPTVKRLLGEAAEREKSAQQKIDVLAGRKPIPPVDDSEIGNEITGIHDAIERLEKRATMPSGSELEVQAGSTKVRLGGITGWQMVALVAVLTLALLLAGQARGWWVVLPR